VEVAKYRVDLTGGVSAIHLRKVDVCVS